ncbi:Phytanoyl-CoA dioxygenase (PhyH) [Abditibacterium utsteinense]|uniref:Phytanoyl-CoA dioxygenase (PhyH) n=1 Tax=Abditibacterium utsteinense TaxID=1960156 RepID=A0A2S8SW86_9BACT|nr:phytanoyl-CoA dioxygenase family protein [Abditibacterium utsteinense]PQV65029.1 Phytanoyl-CoA dioxygenase (PhyH) [Abditibacterium utsteinense]
MQLTLVQKTALQENGFLLLPGAVAPEMVNRALQTINFRLGQGFPAEELAKWSAQSYFPDLQRETVITDLFNASFVRPTLSTLLGEGNVQEAKSGQLALRFPREPGTLPHSAGPHIDGVHSPNNGVPKGTLGSFTALVGVFLTDINADFAGNLSVWPGSHLKMEAYFREHGIDALLNEGQTPKLDYGEPLQIQAKAGDAIIAHYQLLHGVTMNLAPMPRFATFFRVTHPLHHENRMKCLSNLWLEWPGVR